MDVDDVLSHHGIRGMRWGVRRKVNPQTGRVSSEHKQSAELRKRPVSSLTNKQLKTTNERLNLEQNFQRLNPSKKEIRRKQTKAILASVGITSVAGFVKSKEGRATISKGSSFIQKVLPKVGSKVSDVGKSQLIKRSATYAVKQRVKNL